MNLTLDTWIISDTHFFHDNIVKYCNRPEDHTERIASAWRSSIKGDDTVLHLGDLFMGINKRDVELRFLLASLTGRKHMLMGNHDRQTNVFYNDFGFRIEKEFVWTTPPEERVLFSHYPDRTRLESWTINIHGHIHNNGYDPSTPTNRDYRNVSVEVMDYKPARLRDILYDGRYQSRVEGGDNEFQTKDATETKGGVVIPRPKEIGYFGS